MVGKVVIDCKRKRLIIEANKEGGIKLTEEAIDCEVSIVLEDFQANWLADILIKVSQVEHTDGFLRSRNDGGSKISIKLRSNAGGRFVAVLVLFSRLRGGRKYLVLPWENNQSRWEKLSNIISQTTTKNHHQRTSILRKPTQRSLAFQEKNYLATPPRLNVSIEGVYDTARIPQLFQELFALQIVP